MLMVVLGAGASYDSVPSYPSRVGGYASMSERLPLAKDLFDNRPEFSDVMQRFPRCQPIVPYVRNPPPDRTVEQVLEVSVS